MKTDKKIFDCVRCEAADLIPGPVELPGTVRGESFTVKMNGLLCPKCGYGTIEGPEMQEYGRLLADKYRAAHGLLTSEEIRERRKRLGMSQEQFADYLGVGVASVKRWELGKIQDERSNKLILERTEVPLGTDTNVGYTDFVQSSSTVTCTAVQFIDVGTAAIDPNPEPSQITMIEQSLEDAMSANFFCSKCKQTAWTSIILDVPDYQTVPPYIASVFNRSQERFSNGRRK